MVVYYGGERLFGIATQYVRVEEFPKRENLYTKYHFDPAL